MQSLSALGSAVGHLLKERRQTLAVAESAAGGLINAALVAVPGASACYLGGGVIQRPDRKPLWGCAGPRLHRGQRSGRGRDASFQFANKGDLAARGIAMRFARRGSAIFCCSGVSPA